MGVSQTYDKEGAVLVAVLEGELKAAAIPVVGVAYNSAEQWVRVDFDENAGQAAIDAAAPIVAAHTGVDPVRVSQADIRTRWGTSSVHGKTPAQIYTLMQGQIDGWTSLAQAKADLRVWLPLLAAAVGWLVLPDDQR